MSKENSKRPPEQNHTKAFKDLTKAPLTLPRLLPPQLRKRAHRRLKHLGVEVRRGSLLEEERCNISMGGPLPDPTQRIVAFGAAASMVHPSTGYQLCRMLAAAPALAAALGSRLRGGRGYSSPAAIASAAYDAMWPEQRRLQRDFQASLTRLFLFAFVTSESPPVDHTSHLLLFLRYSAASFWRLSLWHGYVPSSVPSLRSMRRCGRGFLAGGLACRGMNGTRAGMVGYGSG